MSSECDTLYCGFLAQAKVLFTLRSAAAAPAAENLTCGAARSDPSRLLRPEMQTGRSTIEVPSSAETPVLALLYTALILAPRWILQQEVGVERKTSPL